MGLPYSRQINAAFEQVTPLVAAGFKVLRTTRDISVFLAVIQVLTVILLFAILLVLVGLGYCVNPDLEHERRTLITPVLRSLARITLYSIIKSTLTIALVLGISIAAVYRLFVVKQWVEDVEYEGNVDADKALEDMEIEISEAEVDDALGDGESEEEKEGQKGKEKNEGKSGKGAKGKKK